MLSIKDKIWREFSYIILCKKLVLRATRRRTYWNFLGRENEEEQGPLFLEFFLYFKGLMMEAVLLDVVKPQIMCLSH